MNRRCRSIGLIVLLSVSSGGFLFAQPLSSRRDPSTAPLPTTSSATLTLDDAFSRALKRSETIDIQEQEIIQAERLMRRTLGTILPNIRWNWTHTIQDTSGVGSGSINGRNLADKSRTEAQFTAVQPLFQGFREFRTLRAGDAAKRAEEQFLKRATALLYQDVALAFYSVILLEEDRADLVNLTGVTEERLKELRERMRLGKSRDSEVTSVESQLYATQADIAEKDAQIDAARALLSFFIGDDASRMSLRDTLGKLGMPDSELSALERAATRSDLLAQRELVESRRYSIAAVRSLRWPGAGVTGNYYTQRVGSQKEVDWDVIFDVDIPIYQGGVIKSDVDIATSQYRQEQAALSRLEREIAREIRANYSALHASLRRTDLLEKAHLQARRSYQSQVREYRLGLVNNLDVLQALRTLEDVKADFNRARIQGKLDWVRLAIAMEALPQGEQP